MNPFLFHCDEIQEIGSDSDDSNHFRDMLLSRSPASVSSERGLHGRRPDLSRQSKD
jgi:hypothetical protein